MGVIIPTITLSVQFIAVKYGEQITRIKGGYLPEDRSYTVTHQCHDCRKEIPKGEMFHRLIYGGIKADQISCWDCWAKVFGHNRTFEDFNNIDKLLKEVEDIK